jgi:hypothetical protein
MSTLSLREPTASEVAFIADVLRRLREHFPEWCSPNAEGYEHDLAAFAFYEGCGGSEHCGAILAEAAPFALGRELVARHGFRWVMLASGDGWRYGVAHPALSDAIDLLSLEDGSWNEVEYDPGGEPAPGEMTHDSLETIVERVREHSSGAVDGADVPHCT